MDIKFLDIDGRYGDFSKMENNSVACFFIAAQSEVCGTFCLYRDDESVNFSNFVIFPKFRRKGVALSALKKLCEILRGHGKYAYFWATVSPDNKAAIALYQKVGAKVCRRMAQNGGKKEHIVEFFSEEVETAK